MIKATGLVKKFGDFTALSSLDTQIDSGSIYGLVGSNGSGKSTLLRLISGVYMPDGGSIEVNGENVFDNVSIKDKVFFLADDLYFLPKSTVDDMAKFYKGVYSGWSDEMYDHLKTVFPINTSKKLGEFSKGMRRQAALILALCCQPEYLLLDEAFDGLDPVIRLLVKRLLAEEMAKRNLTVVVTSHNLRELEDLCDHVGLLHSGRILFEKELDMLKLGFCKVQAAFDNDSDFIPEEFDIMNKQQRGRLFTLLIRGTPDEVLGKLNKMGAVFAEAVPLTLEEVFIGEMEAVGYDYNNIIF